MPDLASNWQKLAQLTGSQWLVILQAPFVLLLTWARLRMGGYQATLERIHPVSAPSTAEDQQLQQARRTAYALDVAVKFGPWRPRCLLRSLALCRLLARRGISFDIRIGVPLKGPARTAGGAIDFNAHAWVEHAGVVLNDRPDIAEEFRVFESGPDSA